MTVNEQPEENVIAPLSWPEGPELVLENPYDFKPALDALMQKVEQIRAALPGQKIVIPIGENHDAYAHDYLQAVFIKALAKRHPGQIAYGYEYDHNYGAYATQHIDTGTTEGREAHRLWQREFFLDNIRAFPNWHCLKIGVTKTLSLSMSMNDVACVCEKRSLDQKLVCDLSDQDTRDFVYRAYGYLPSQEALIRFSPSDFLSMRDGLKISNGFMAHKIGEHFDDTAAEIYVQTCGATHLVGYVGCEHEYKHSLTYALGEKGYAVLPVFLDSKAAHYTTIPPEGLDVLCEKGIIVKGLDDSEDLTSEEQGRYAAAMGPLFDFS